MFDLTRLDAQWYEFLEEVAGAFYHAMGVMRARANETAPLAPLFAVRSGYAESPAWFMVQAAEFEPDALTVDKLRVRDIYASERIVNALLELMASEKWFDRRAQDEYVLSDAGREMMARMFARRRNWLGMLHVGLDDELADMERVLRALLDASLSALHGAWCLEHSRRRAHWQEISTLAKIFQYLEDFNAARDDAHMAAWMPLGVSGFVWEAFASIAAEQARDADALFDQLHYRGYTRMEYAAALQDLGARGWLEREANDAWCVTNAGRTVRAQVEFRTDFYFYAAWKELEDPELVKLHQDLQIVRDALLLYV